MIDNDDVSAPAPLEELLEALLRDPPGTWIEQVEMPSPAQLVAAHHELRAISGRVQPGQAPVARRIAELLEMLGRDEEAAVWWWRAAREGDRDAIDYVREFIDLVDVH